MADRWFSCEACSSADPTSDTVKVNPKLISMPNIDKENVKPVQRAEVLRCDEKLEAKPTQALKDSTSRYVLGQIVYVMRSSGEWSQGAVAETSSEALTVVLKDGGQKQVPMELVDTILRPLTEEQRKQAEEELRLNREQKAAAEAERQRQDAEIAACKASEEKERLESEARQLEEAAAEQERLRKEAEKREQEQAQREESERNLAMERVTEWCKRNGYQDLGHSKKTFRGATKFPLHTAVKHADEEMVRFLMLCGADGTVMDSRNQTPRQLAMKLNKNGSHDLILSALS